MVKGLIEPGQSMNTTSAWTSASARLSRCSGPSSLLSSTMSPSRLGAAGTSWTPGTLVSGVASASVTRPSITAPVSSSTSLGSMPNHSVAVAWGSPSTTRTLRPRAPRMAARETRGGCFAGRSCGGGYGDDAAHQRVASPTGLRAMASFGFPLPRLVAGQSSKVVVVDDAGRVPCGCPVGVLVVLVLADCPDLDPRQVLAGGVAFGAIGLGVPQSIRKKCRDVEHPRS